jgi:hypothetical protein
MKKIISVISLFSMLLLAIPFALQAQDMARVTVTIKNLTHVPIDDAAIDFYAKIFIGDKIKTFPVRTGNQLRDLNWQFTTTTSSSTANIRIEIWDDDALLSGGDDIVCVNGKSTAITKSISTMEIYNANFRSTGACTGSGKESGAISYNITIEPTRTAYITQGIWKEVKQEFKTGTGEWEQLIITPGSAPRCSADDFRIFRKNGTYVLYAGAVKCNPTQPVSQTGSWSFQNNDSKLQLTVSGNSLAIIYTVHWIDDGSMMLSTSSTAGGVTTYNRFTYKH